ncbi:MAG: hypothetical protein OXQ96_03665 [Alphaproteobacteria bacterium]|nr:hypothetical protein [Alphaproteobacteria bacterium]
MGRTSFRNLWLCVVVILLGTAWFLFQKAEKVWASISQTEAMIIQLRREKNNVENLSASLTELDSLTVDERNTTRLDLLRHLNLETKDYKFSLVSRQEEQLGGIKLFVRKFELATELPYAKALQLADTLHANKKVVLHSYVMFPVGSSANMYGDLVSIKMKGSLYGLEKK